MKSKSPMILFGAACISGLLVFVWMKNWGTCSHANKTVCYIIAGPLVEDILE